MSDSAVVATPSNFDAHLASVDMSGPDDGGVQTVQDNTGPSNTNALTPSRDPQAMSQRIQQSDGPEYRVGDDGQPLQLDENGMPLDGQQGPDEHEAEVVDGMPPYEQLQAMFQATQAPELHEYFLDKTVPTPVNGTVVPKTVRELQQGYMRMADYSRGKQEAAHVTRQAQEVIQNNRMLFQRMADPGVLRATLKRLGPAHEQAFVQAATQLAQERLQLMKMQPHERALFDAQQQRAEIERQTQELREQLERQRQENQPHPSQQYIQPIHQTLDAHVPSAWARHGIRNSPIAIQTFAMHIQNVWDGRMETIPQAIEHASAATAEELGDRVAQHQKYGQQQRPQPAQPLAPRRLPPGAPAAGQRRPAPTGARVTGFDDYLKGLR